jgi:hypothetical protein
LRRFGGALSYTRGAGGAPPAFRPIAPPPALRLLVVNTRVPKDTAALVAGVRALREAGRSVGNSVELADKDKKTVGRFRVGQVMHNGAWKTRAAAFPMLLNQLNVETGTKVSFDVRDVSLKDSQIFEMPFMYLTGTTDFTLEPEERTNLRQYLAKGGVLFVEAGEGRISFDKSFRQELTQLLPGKQLVQIPQGHELFRQPRNVSSVKARPALAAGVALAVMETLADYGAVQFLDVQTLTTGVVRAWFVYGSLASAALFALPLLGVAA